MITRSFNKLNVDAIEMKIGTGFYSDAAYDALMLINCLEAGCNLMDEFITEYPYKTKSNIDYELNAWIKIKARGCEEYLPRKYVDRQGGRANPWNKTEVIRDFTNGEIILRSIIDKPSYELWNIVPAEYLQTELKKAALSTYIFIELIGSNDYVVLESEGTGFLNPFSFFGGHISPTERYNNENYYKQYFAKLISKNYGRPTYIHKVSKTAVISIFDAWTDNSQPNSILTEQRHDPFRLQVEKDIYDTVRTIKREAVSDVLSPNFLSKNTLGDDPKKSSTFYRVLKMYESKQRKLMEELQ